MSKRFVVLVENRLGQDTEAISAALPKGWWHWIEGAWLVSTSDESVTHETLSNTIMKLAPGANSLVIQVEPGANWMGYGPASAESSYFKWLRQFWS